MITLIYMYVYECSGRIGGRSCSSVVNQANSPNNHNLLSSSSSSSSAPTVTVNNPNNPAHPQDQSGAAGIDPGELADERELQAERAVQLEARRRARLDRAGERQERQRDRARDHERNNRSVGRRAAAQLSVSSSSSSSSGPSADNNTHDNLENPAGEGHGLGSGGGNQMKIRSDSPIPPNPPQTQNGLGENLLNHSSSLNNPRAHPSATWAAPHPLPIYPYRPRTQPSASSPAAPNNPQYQHNLNNSVSLSPQNALPPNPALDTRPVSSVTQPHNPLSLSPAPSPPPLSGPALSRAMEQLRNTNVSNNGLLKGSEVEVPVCLLPSGVSGLALTRHLAGDIKHPSVMAVDGSGSQMRQHQYLAPMNPSLRIEPPSHELELDVSLVHIPYHHIITSPPTYTYTYLLSTLIFLSL